MASDKWSDTATIATTTTSGPSRQSIKDEVGAVAEVLKEERGKDSMTIGIVREEGLKRLRSACAYSRGLFERRGKHQRLQT